MGEDYELVEEIRELPCPSCGSSDSLTVYIKENQEGEKKIDGICWSSCRAEDGTGFKGTKFIEENDCLNSGGFKATKKRGGSKVDHSEILEEISGYDSRGVRDRKIKKKYAEMYGMKVKYDDGGNIIEHYYPVHKEGLDEPTGYFKRSLPKQFSAIGDVKDCKLQGQELFERGGKYENQAGTKFIVVTEGFLDALAAQQMLSEYNSKYMTAVVSLPNGANPKAIAANADFLDRYENIIFAFDQDSVGKENAKKCSKVFKAGKCKIMSYSEKDPAEMLKQHGTTDKQGDRRDLITEFAQAFWNSADHRPSQILSVSDIVERAMKLPEMGLSFPWPTATEKTLGIRRGEIHIVGAAPKIGKTEHQHQMIKHMTEVHGEVVGVMSLEENPVKTLKKVAGKYAGKQFTKPPQIGNYTLEEMRSAYDLLDGKIEFYSSEGVRDAEEVLKTVRYWASKGIWFFIIDPLTALVAEHSSGEANDILNSFMSKAASMAMELDITFFLYSHVNPVKNGKPHDQGGDVLSSQFTGSRAMEKWAHYGWGIQRDRTEKDARLRNTARVTMLFDREYGEYCEYFAYYNNQTNDWSECSDPESEDSFDTEMFGETPPIEDFDEEPVELKSSEMEEPPFEADEPLY